jgi:Mn-dependent DtxR family transcriptional regulator
MLITSNNYSNHSNFISDAYLSKATNADRKTVMKYAEILKELGLINYTKGEFVIKTTNEYELLNEWRTENE